MSCLIGQIHRRGVPSSIRALALASHMGAVDTTTPACQSPGSSKLSPKKLFNHLLHPTWSREEIQDRSATKCARAEDAEVLVVKPQHSVPGPSHRSVPSLSEGDASHVLKHFRMPSNYLYVDSLLLWASAHYSFRRWKDDYQVLYFPLMEPLDESQRTARRVVTSVKATE